MKSVYSNINNYPDITLNTELGHMHIIDYIDHIREDGWFGGELEISTASILYDINISMPMKTLIIIMK